VNLTVLISLLHVGVERLLLLLLSVPNDDGDDDDDDDLGAPLTASPHCDVMCRYARFAYKQ